MTYPFYRTTVTIAGSAPIDMTADDSFIWDAYNTDKTAPGALQSTSGVTVPGGNHVLAFADTQNASAIGEIDVQSGSLQFRVDHISKYLGVDASTGNAIVTAGWDQPLSAAALSTLLGPASVINDIGLGASTVLSGAGNNYIHGNGQDTVVFSKPSSHYNVSQAYTGSNVTAVVDKDIAPDPVGGGGVSWAIDGTIALKFTDQTMFIGNSDTATMARLYTAALGRQPDAAGLKFMTDYYTGHVSLMDRLDPVAGSAAMVPFFTSSPEFQAKYGSPDKAALVTQLYENVLHRAPEAGAVDWYLAHQSNQTQLVAAFSASAENIANSHAWFLLIS